MECTPAGHSILAAHGLNKLYKEINYKLSPTPYNQGG